MERAIKLEMEANSLRLVNDIRQTLQVHTIAEICTLKGDRIQKWAWDVTVPVSNKVLEIWPRTGKISASAMQEWRRLLSSFTWSRYDHRLTSPLGAWLVQPPQRWWYSQGSRRLYKRKHHIWCKFHRKKGRPSRDTIGTFHKSGKWVTELPPDLQMTEVNIQKSGNVAP